MLFQGFNFFFGLWPKGEKAVNSKVDAMGVYLFFQDRPNDNVCISVDFSVSLCNTLYAPMNMFASFENITFPLIDGGEGWGDPSLIKTSFITKDSGYVNSDGFLTLNCSLKVNNLQHML